MKDEDIKLPDVDGSPLCITVSVAKEYAREAVRLNMPNYGPSIDEEKHSLRMSAKDGKGAAAIKTLESLGYTYNCGELWKPPLGKKPDYITSEALPFDLEKAKAGHPIVTRDGRKAKFIAYVPGEVNFQVVALIEGDEAPVAFTTDGSRFRGGLTSLSDLFLHAATRKVWALYLESGHVCLFDSKERADEFPHEAMRMPKPRFPPIEIEIPDLG